MNCLINKVILLLFSFTTLTSCSVNAISSRELPGDINILKENIDTYIKLKDSNILKNSHKNNDLLFLDLVNLSESTIVFPKDFGIILFSKNKQEWENLYNNFSYAEQENTLPPLKDFPSGQIVSCIPYFENLTSPVVVKIIIVGNIENKPDQKVAAQIDVLITP